MFLAAETLMTSNMQRLRILRPCLLTASPTTLARGCFALAVSILVGLVYTPLVPHLPDTPRAHRSLVALLVIDVYIIYCVVILCKTRRYFFEGRREARRSLVYA